MFLSLATLVKLLTGTKASMCGDDLDFVVGRTEGYSQSDLTNLAGQAAMEPLRELSSASILTVKREHIRGVCKSDFEAALAFARPSVDSTTLSKLETFASKFGMQ
jgi:SpoVK/Ycf46/Vps4 family AAA+-type ATPase